MRTRLRRGRGPAGIVVLGAAAALTVVVLVLVLGPRVTGPTTTDLTAAASTPAAPTPGPTEPGASETGAPTDRAKTSDPIAFARRTSSTLFDWDTTTDSPAAITNEILAVADRTGQETPGLLADLPAYVPDQSWWQRLAEYDTSQHLEITGAFVPTVWTHAVATGQVPDLLPGTAAVTIEGIRRRAGEVAGNPEATSSRVAFTMFVVCPPGNECRLLRLGAPGKVLE